MNDPSTLFEIFFSHAPPGHGGPADPEALQRSLTALYERGHATWPNIELSAPDFVRHLATHLPAKEDVERFLAVVHANDLYLACGCALGAASAIAAFDRSILNQVPAFLARMDPSPVLADEIRQLLREKLLVAGAGKPPKIAEYSGAGALWSWVRVVAIRTAISLRRKRDEQPQQELNADVAKTLPLGQDVEIDYIRTRYQREFEAALREAFARLPTEQRHVLRLHFVGGLTGDAIAAMLQVNRRTVGRWLASAKTAMFLETRRLLQSRLRVSPAELDSLVRTVRTSFDLSLSTLLKSGDIPPLPPDENQ